VFLALSICTLICTYEKKNAVSNKYFRQQIVDFWRILFSLFMLIYYPLLF